MASPPAAAGRSRRPFRRHSKESSPPAVQRPLLFVSALALTVAPSFGQSSGARNRAMGGAGVASSHPFNAQFVNPALMRHRTESLGVGIVIPYIDVVVRDQNELVDALDDFQDTLNDLDAAINAAVPDPLAQIALGNQAVAELNALDGRNVDFETDAGIGTVIPMEGWTLGLGVRNYVSAVVVPDIDPADQAAIAAAIAAGDSTVLDNLASQARGLAAVVTEFGVSAAFDVELAGIPFSLGITPKAQSIETVNYAVSVSTFDDGDALDDFDDDQFTESDDTFNLDLGLAAHLSDSFTLGVSIRDLIEDEFDSVLTSGSQFQFEIQTRPVVGLAYEHAGLTIAADIDATKTSPFSGGAESQMLRIGTEYDVAGWLQLRSGFQTDLEDVRADLVSLGLGVSPFETLRIDLFGQVGENSGGAGIQIALTL